MIEDKQISKSQSSRTDQDFVDHIMKFLKSISIDVEAGTLSGDTFLPGLEIEEGTLIVDLEKLKYPGDLLHEAGHIAVSEPELRPLIGTENMTQQWPTDGEELAAILWSFAAAKHLEIPLDVVFHPNGYKHQSAWLIKQFESEIYIGLPFLEWMSLCDAKEFPKMKKWLR